jgi:hypothetical protein
VSDIVVVSGLWQDIGAYQKQGGVQENENTDVAAQQGRYYVVSHHCRKVIH